MKAKSWTSTAEIKAAKSQTGLDEDTAMSKQVLCGKQVRWIADFQFMFDDQLEAKDV